MVSSSSSSETSHGKATQRSGGSAACMPDELLCVCRHCHAQRTQKGVAREKRGGENACGGLGQEQRTAAAAASTDVDDDKR